MGKLAQAWQMVMSGDVAPPSLEERIRSTFTNTIDEEIQGAINDRIAELYHGGRKAEPLYVHTANRIVNANTPEGTKRVEAPVEVVDSYRSEDSKPYGYRIDGQDISADKDPELADKIAKIKENRLEVLDDLRSSGEELGFSERIAPGVKTTEAGVLSNLKERYDPKNQGNVIPVGDPDGHIIILREGKPPALADIKGFMQGSITGDIADALGDIGEGGLAAGIGAGLAYMTGRQAGPGATVASVAPISVTADIAANAIRQGASGLLPGKDYPNQTLTESLPERALQGVVTAAGGLAGEAVGRKVMGPLARKAIGFAKARFARGLAKAAEEEVSALASGKKVGEFLAESRAVQEEISALGKTKARMSIGQATGQEAAIGREFDLAAMAESRPGVIAQQRKRLADGAKAMDALVALAAHDADELGNDVVGKQLAVASVEYIDSLRELRKAQAGALYEQVEKVTGNLFPIQAPVGKAKELARQYERIGAARAKLSKAVEFLTGAAKNGRVSIQDLNQERRFWSQVSAGELKLSRELSPAMNVRIAAQMLESIDESMAKAGADRELAGAAAHYLKQANAIWSSYTGQINNFLGVQKGSRRLGLVGKLIGLSADQNDEAIIKTLSRAPKRQIQTVLSTLEAIPSGKAAAEQARAQLLLEVFRKGGHLGESDELGIGERVSRVMTPSEISDAIQRNDGMLSAIFEKHPETRNKLKAIARWFDRISQGPQVPGGVAPPSRFDARFAEAMERKGVLEAASSKVMELGRKAIRRAAEVGDVAFLSDKQIAYLSTTPQGVDSLYELSKTQANPYRAQAWDRGARAIVHMFTILERGGMLEDNEE